jgi:hypothetical protein
MHNALRMGAALSPQEGLQQLRRDLREAAAAEANSQLGRLQDVDARLRGEMLALTANLKTVVSTCSSHQEQMNLQVRQPRLQPGVLRLQHVANGRNTAGRVCCVLW